MKDEHAVFLWTVLWAGLILGFFICPLVTGIVYLTTVVMVLILDAIQRLDKSK